ncbi:HAD hydrolase family protein [Bacillus sonorensis]|nr:HAD hydrolase family protein [Bacillus sonorensis]
MNFVFDLDGTICFEGQSVSEHLLMSFEELKAQGHEVIFASARPIRICFLFCMNGFIMTKWLAATAQWLREKERSCRQHASMTAPFPT